MDPQNTNQPPIPPQQPMQPPVEPQTMPVAPQPPMMQPTQPMPQGPAPMGGFTPQSVAGGPNKKLLIGIIAGVVGLLVVILVVVLLVSSMSVSKKDYIAALDQYNSVAEANSTLNLKASTLQYGLSLGTDTSFDNDVDAAKEAIEKVNTENDKLGELKAMKVGEGKTKYQAFDEKLDTYTKYIDDLLTSVKDARAAYQTCDKVSGTGSSSQYKSSLATCITALGKVSSTPNADIKEFMGKLKSEYEKLSSIVDKIAAIKDPYGDQYDQYKSLRDQLYTIQDNIRDASTDFRSNLEKHGDEVDPKDVAKDLGDFLVEKSNG